MALSEKLVLKIFSKYFLPITTTEFYMKILLAPVLLVPVVMDLSALKMTFVEIAVPLSTKPFVHPAAIMSAQVKSFVQNAAHL